MNHPSLFLVNHLPPKKDKWESEMEEIVNIQDQTKCNTFLIWMSTISAVCVYLCGVRMDYWIQHPCLRIYRRMKMERKRMERHIRGINGTQRSTCPRINIKEFNTKHFQSTFESQHPNITTNLNKIKDKERKCYVNLSFVLSSLSLNLEASKCF